MGYYIEVERDFNKANQIIDTVPGARLIARAGEATADEFPVCVVTNAWFEAAGVAYDSHEVEAFSDPSDPRPKTWLAVPRDEALRLVPDLDRVV